MRPIAVFLGSLSEEIAIIFNRLARQVHKPAGVRVIELLIGLGRLRHDELLLATAEACFHPP